MFLVAAIVAALAAVPLTGGTLTALGNLRVRHGFLIGAALGVQILIVVVADGNPFLHRALHVSSYVLAGVFVWANRRVPGIWVAALGGFLNLVAIVVNGGVMPAGRDALRTAGISPAHGFANSQALAHPRLLFLGDVFAIPRAWPLHNVFSVGDVLIAVGFAAMIHITCRTRAEPVVVVDSR